MIKTKPRSFLFDTVKMTAPERNGFDLSHENKQTCKAGYLYPFEVLEALPNDDFQIQVEQFIRLQPMLSPTMHRLKSYWHWFFVPNRLCWNYWEEFISRGNGKKLDSSQSYVPPEPVTITLYDMLFCHTYKNYEDPDYITQRVSNYMAATNMSGSASAAGFWVLSLDEQLAVLQGAFPEFLIKRGSDADNYTRFNCFCATPRVATSMGIVDTCIFRGSIGADQSEDKFVLDTYLFANPWSFLENVTNSDFDSTVFLQMGDLINRLKTIKLSVMPLVAYALTYNEYYRDENLIEDLEELINYFREETGALDCGNFLTASRVRDLLQIYYRAWEKDYFTTATQMPQKAPDVLIPNVPTNIQSDGDLKMFATGSMVSDAAAGTVYSVNHRSVNGGLIGNGIVAEDTSSLRNYVYGSGLKLNNQGQGTTVADVRKAFALQRWFEKAVRSGTRYIETLKAFFNSDAGDARLQRPEYIGGTAEPIQISDVVQNSATADGSDTPQGNLAGYGISAGTSGVLHYHAPEHGFVFGIFSILARTSYGQGIPKMFSRETWLDYAFPEFEHIGEQGIQNKELYAAPLTKDVFTDENVSTSLTLSDSTANQIFGYQSRYSEYKQMQDRFGGAFARSLDFWSLGRIFDNEPTLSREFVEANISDRNFAVSRENRENLDVNIYDDVEDVDTDQYICDFWVDIKKVTSLTLYSEPI